MAEIRYVKPYFSMIKLVLNKSIEAVAVQDSQGRQSTQLRDEEPQITANITGWLNGQIVRSDNVTFPHEPTDAPSMSDVLAMAKQGGVDVVEAWTDAFDAIADQFPQTAEQPSGSGSIGPAVYLRPDAFQANLHPDRKKSILIKVGVYSDSLYAKLQTNLHLVFEDGATKREREANVVQLNAAKVQAEATLVQVQDLIVLKQTSQTIPESVNPQFASQTVEQLQGLVKQIEQEIKYREAQILELSQVITGDLSVLLGNSTPLHQSVMASVGALCTAILMTLKTSNPDYAGIDVQAIMSEFAIPDIS
jgi:hypothetical protein